MLLFKAHFLPLIRSGTKTQTIRLWKSPRVRVGQLAYSPGLGRLLITAIDTIPNLSALTRQDARADGFATKTALLAEIRRLYHPLPKDRNIYRIQFYYPAPQKDPIPALSQTLKRTSQNAKPKTRPSKIPLAQQRQTLRHFLVALAPK